LINATSENILVFVNVIIFYTLSTGSSETAEKWTAIHDGKLEVFLQMVPVI